MPPWARQFFCLFEAQQNLSSASVQAAETRNERRSVVTGLIGQQAPLGNYQNQRPIQLCTETSRNIGTPRQRQMNMGDFNVEVVGEDTINNERMEDEFLVEGLDDTVSMNVRHIGVEQIMVFVVKIETLTLVPVETIPQHDFST
jgi:hypothetical protein